MVLLFLIMLIWFICVIIGDYIRIKEIISGVRNTINGIEEKIDIPPNPHKSGAKGVTFIKQFAVWHLFLYKVDIHYKWFCEQNTCPYPPSFFYIHGEEEAREIIDRELDDLIKMLNHPTIR